MSIVDEINKDLEKMGGDTSGHTVEEAMDKFGDQIIKEIGDATELPEVTSEDEGDVLMVNSEGKWGKGEIPAPEPELPEVTSDYVGTVLTVNSEGKWDKGAVLPDPESGVDDDKLLMADEGDYYLSTLEEVFKIWNDHYEEYLTVKSVDGDAKIVFSGVPMFFEVTFSIVNNRMRCDKTIQQIWDAYKAGARIKVNPPTAQSSYTAIAEEYYLSLIYNDSNTFVRFATPVLYSKDEHDTEYIYMYTLDYDETQYTNCNMRKIDLITHTATTWTPQ